MSTMLPAPPTNDGPPGSVNGTLLFSNDKLLLVPGFDAALIPENFIDFFKLDLFKTYTPYFRLI